MVQSRTAAEAGSTTVVSSARVRVSEDAVRVGAPASPHAHRGEPKVILVREDGVVRAIDIICSCGERTRVRCDYA